MDSALRKSGQDETRRLSDKINWKDQGLSFSAFWRSKGVTSDGVLGGRMINSFVNRMNGEHSRLMYWSISNNT